MWMVGKGPLEVDFRADAAAAGDPFGLNRPDHPISGPAGSQAVRPQERVVLVVAVLDVRRRHGDPKHGELGKLAVEGRGVVASDFEPLGESA